MFEITVKTDFAAAHRLNNYHGACENLHGHNFIVEVSVLCNKLDNSYIAIDFRELKKIVKNIVSRLDHTYLNDHDYFKNTNPTSEMIAKYIYEQTEATLGKNCRPRKVSVYETQNSKATYWGDELWKSLN